MALYFLIFVCLFCDGGSGMLSFPAAAHALCRVFLCWKSLANTRFKNDVKVDTVYKVRLEWYRDLQQTHSESNQDASLLCSTTEKLNTLTWQWTVNFQKNLSHYTRDLQSLSTVSGEKTWWRILSRECSVGVFLTRDWTDDPWTCAQVADDRVPVYMCRCVWNMANVCRLYFS